MYTINKIKGHMAMVFQLVQVYMFCRSHCYASMLSVPSINIIIWYESAKIICKSI